jgi:hypothetical protein
MRWQTAAVPQPVPLPPAAPAAPPAAAPAAPPAPVLRDCCVCLDDVAAEALVALTPCGHRCVCGPCAELLLHREPAARRCPKCRAALTGMLRVYDE